MDVLVRGVRFAPPPPCTLSFDPQIVGCLVVDVLLQVLAWMPPHCVAPLQTITCPLPLLHVGVVQHRQLMSDGLLWRVWKCGWGARGMTWWLQWPDCCNPGIQMLWHLLCAAHLWATHVHDGVHLCLMAHSRCQ